MICMDGTSIDATSPIRLGPVTLAMHLGRLPRWQGNLRTWWSVLQHSLLVEAMAEADGHGARVRLGSLGHDKHEFITGDWPRPWLPDVVRMIQGVIDARMDEGHGLAPLRPEEEAIIRRLDEEALVTEAVFVVHPPELTADILKDRPWGIETARQREPLLRQFYREDPVAGFLACWEERGAFVQMFALKMEALLKMPMGEADIRLMVAEVDEERRVRMEREAAGG